MKTFPLGLPPEQYDAVKSLADKTGLAMADILRQSVRAGLPRLEEQLREAKGRNKLKPFTREEEQAVWGKGRKADELDALAAHCAGLRVPEPE